MPVLVETADGRALFVGVGADPWGVTLYPICANTCATLAIASGVKGCLPATPSLDNKLLSVDLVDDLSILLDSRRSFFEFVAGVPTTIFDDFLLRIVILLV